MEDMLRLDELAVSASLVLMSANAQIVADTYRLMMSIVKLQVRDM